LETAEYKRSWGLTAQKASTAYALGYYGQGVTVGIMDSGVQAEHMEFQGGRFIPVVQQAYTALPGTGTGIHGQSIAGSVNLVTGLLWPGLSPAESAFIGSPSSPAEVSVPPGNALSVGFAVHIGHKAGFESTIRSNTDYTRVVTTSNCSWMARCTWILKVRRRPARC
jgi:subtilisin family serine protease